MNLKSNPIKSVKMSEERMSYSIEKDGMTISYEVRKAENGYIMKKSVYGEKDGKYIDECKEYVSATNPLAKKKEEIKDPIEAKEEMFSLLDGFR